jgi:hypothetical protein
MRYYKSEDNAAEFIRSSGSIHNARESWPRFLPLIVITAGSLVGFVPAFLISLSIAAYLTGNLSQAAKISLGPAGAAFGVAAMYAFIWWQHGWEDLERWLHGYPPRDWKDVMREKPRYYIYDVQTGNHMTSQGYNANKDQMLAIAAHYRDQPRAMLSAPDLAQFFEGNKDSAARWIKQFINQGHAGWKNPLYHNLGAYMTQPGYDYLMSYDPANPPTLEASRTPITAESPITHTHTRNKP